MAAWNTGKDLQSKDPAKSTAKALAGRRYEAIGRILCRKKRFKILALNCRLGRDEIDILARDRNLHYVAVEVRGRCSFQFPPTQYLSEPKVSALKRAASKLAKQKREYVRIEFIEILGSLPDSKFKLAWLYLRIWLGIGTHLRVRWFEV